MAEETDDRSPNEMKHEVEIEEQSNSTVDLGFSNGEGIDTSVEGSNGVDTDGDLVKSVETGKSSVDDVDDSKEEELNSFIDAKSSADNLLSTVDIVAGEGESASAAIEVEKSAGISADEESRILLEDCAVDIQEDDEDDNENDDQTQDAGKEETFVDAMDQLNASDGRSTDNGESTLYVETQENPDEKHALQEVEDSTQVLQMKYELSLLQASLDQTVGDKGTMEQKYKEERDMLRTELADLHRQLEVMADQRSLLVENGNQQVDHLPQDKEDKVQDFDIPLNVIIAECSKFTTVLKSTLEEQLQSEGTMRELHAVLFAKDQEIEDLNAMVNELLVSNDVVVSYWESLQGMWSQSLKELSKDHIERDLHVEGATKRLLSSIASIVKQEDLSDDSVTGRLSLLEKGTSLMIGNYNRFLSEINHLRQCLTDSVTETKLPDESGPWTVFDMVREELVGHQKKELDFIEKLNQVEGENRKMLEQLGEEKERMVVADAELRKLKLELEQEKIKTATSKEKLSMAVTKGKALVQQRDALKQSLAEKTNELEKCLFKLEEQSKSLDAAEIRMEELVRIESMASSLQDSLSKRETVLTEIEEILSQTDMANGLHSIDVLECVRWLAEQRNVLLGVSMEYNKLKDNLATLNLPETVASYELGSQINWLGESLSLARDNMVKLQGEIVVNQVALASHESELGEAYNEIEHLKASLLAEKQEKDSLQMGLENLLCKYEAIVEKEFQVSSAKDKMVRLFVEASGVEDQGVDNQLYSGMVVFVEKCVAKIREQCSASFESSNDARREQFEKVQSLLYVKDQELMLHKGILEEDMLERSEFTKLSNELNHVSQQFIVLKAEKNSLQKDLERSDDKATLLREKLSMAVKKGKGLVQEREGLRRSIDEKNTEIEKLKLELQQQESMISGFRDQISRLFSDLEHIPNLESDLLATENQRDQLEQFLLESNSLLQRMVESIESVALPGDTTFEEPVGKVKRLAECLNEYQVGKAFAEQELEKVKEEVNSLSGTIAEAHQTIGSLEASLSELEKNNTLLQAEKKDLQVGKADIEQELEKAKEEASSQGSKLAEASARIKILEDALSLAEKNIAVLGEEKAAAYVAQNFVEEELEKVREEASYYTSNLAEANMTIKSLEEALFQVEKNISSLKEENDAAQVGRASLGKELEEVKYEAGSQSSKLADAYASVKSLEDALSMASSNISALVDEKKDAEREIQSLHAKLSASMEELAGTHGSLESQFVEIFGYINHLRLIMKDDALLSLVAEGFKKKIASLRDLNFLLKDIQDLFGGKGSEELQYIAGTEKDPEETSSAYRDSLPNGSIEYNEPSPTDLSDISSYLMKIVEGFKTKNKLLEEKFEGFFSTMDERIALLLRALQATRDEINEMLLHRESLKLEVENLEAHKQAQESTISTLKGDMTVLLSGCADAAKELQMEVDNNLVDLSSNLETREAREDAMGREQWGRIGSITDVKDAENLVLAAREFRNQIKKLEDAKYVSLTTIQDLQNKLQEIHLTSENAVKERDLSQDRASMLEKDLQNKLQEIQDLQNKLQEIHLTSENAVKERDLSQDRVSMLEKDLEALQNICSEMKQEIQDYQAKEDTLREKYEELSSLHHSASVKEQEGDGYFLPELQVKTLFEKIDQIKIPIEKSDMKKPELHGLAPLQKLFFIIDNVVEMQHQIKLLSRDKEQLQSSLATQVQETGHLRKEAETLINANQDLGKTKSDLIELTLDLEKLIYKLRGDGLIEDTKFVGVKQFLPLLENLVMAISSACEASKSKAQESDARLHEKQRLVDELSAKVKLLEDSVHSRPAPPDPVLDRSIFEASSLAAGSEISEIEEAGPLGRNSISPAPTAAHVRTLRKGSSDHLALTIDSESNRLINHHETDDDKGHMFKSLNTSGLVPKQGKLMADRIDGIWVSGGRALMSRPRARVGVIAYCLLLHIWLLGAIL